LYIQPRCDWRKRGEEEILPGRPKAPSLGPGAKPLWGTLGQSTRKLQDFRVYKQSRFHQNGVNLRKIQFMKLNVYKSFNMTDISVIPYRLIIHSFTLKRALT
jgi:hypothetical protein